VASATMEKIPVVTFKLLRAPTPPPEPGLRRDWVEDDFYREPDRTHVSPPDEHSLVRRSQVVARVFQAVFCDYGATVDTLIRELLGNLQDYRPVCPPFTLDPGTAALVLEDLDRYPYVMFERRYYFPPATLYQLRQTAALISPLIAAGRVLRRPGKTWDKDVLYGRLKQALGNIDIVDVIFNGREHSDAYIEAKRVLFDALYLLQILRRRTPLNAGDIIAGLGVLHTLEALAVDQVHAAATALAATDADRQRLSGLSAIVPELRDPGTAATDLPLIRGRADLRKWLTASPLIHPLICCLFHYPNRSENPRPIGIGDLKVVKQWLTGYEAVDFSDIKNVMKHEQRTQVLRNIAKTEDTFTFTDEQQRQTSSEAQTTNKSELAQEIENVVKTDTTINAALSLGVTSAAPIGGLTLTSNASSSFAYANSRTDSQKISASFAEEVVNKAVQSLQTKSSAVRTSTRSHEAHETRRHVFDNTKGKKHTSGMYQWVNKKYRAQVFNYGKRLMYEFIVHEPAALLIESRMAAFNGTLQVPQPPVKPAPPELPQWVQELTPDTITLLKFHELSLSYDLSDLTYPAPIKYAPFVRLDTGKNWYNEDWGTSSRWQQRTYSCRLGAKDYVLDRITIDGWVHFWDEGEGLAEAVGTLSPADVNTLRVWVNGYPVFYRADNSQENWYFVAEPAGNLSRGYNVGTPQNPMPPFDDDTVTLELGLLDFADFDFSFHAKLLLDPDTLTEFQQEVVFRVTKAEQDKANFAYGQLQRQYEVDYATYRNDIDELKHLVVNDMVSGTSEQENRATMLAELKRLCLTQLTRQMDDNPADDTWAAYDALGTVNVNATLHKFVVEEDLDSDPPATEAGFQKTKTQVSMRLPRLTQAARDKGSMIQFLEQAFEWQQMTFLPYEYNYAPKKRWPELMSYRDRADPYYGQFLRASAARVLVSVTPSYNEAVLHFACTGEPWNGGPVPAIGDPLFLPLFAEIRDTQDDMRNAVAEGKSWTFTLPTSLEYLRDSEQDLPATLP
jgi:hypothetical protein